MKTNEDFNFSVGSALYNLQQRLTNYYSTSPLTRSGIKQGNWVYYTKDMSLHKIFYVNTSTDPLVKTGYYAVRINNHNCNIWSARDHFVLCN